MTLHAQREGQNIIIGGNIGVEVLVNDSRVSYVKITENAQHVLHFHTQLGQLLNAAAAELKHPEK